MIQATADDLRMAVAGQWVSGAQTAGATPRAAGAAGAAGAPLVIHGVGTDTREDLRGRLFVALRGEKFDAHQFLQDAAKAGAVAALVDRKAGAYQRPAGLPLLEVGDTRTALADLARWWRSRMRAKVVAITGSSGKTTTRRLVHAALGSVMRGSASPKSFNNDIGVPLTLLAGAGDDGYMVVEIGMSHPGEIAPLSRMAAPQIAVITMAGRAHIGGMGSVEAIIQEKSSLVDGLSASGMAVVLGDQPALVQAVEQRVKPGVRVTTFGVGPQCHWRLMARSVVEGAESGVLQRMTVQEPDGALWECGLALPGDYNAMNALAAVAVARLMGVPREKVAEALATVGPADMRMARQMVGGVAIYNDAYNANPDAVLASLRAFAELAAGAARRVTVLGDMLELGGPEAVAQMHAEVGRAAAALRPAVAAFVGEGSAHGAQAAQQAGGAGVVVHVPALDEAGIATLAAHLQPGDAVLLKGSRGSRMERLVAALEARAGRTETVPCSTT